MLNIKPFRPFYKHLLKYKFTFSVGIISGIFYATSSSIGLPAIAKTVFPLLFNDSQNKDTPQWLIDWVSQNFENPQEGFLILVCLMLPTIMLVRASSAFINGYCMTHTGVGVLQEIQKEVFTKLQSLPLAFFSKYKSGDIAARVMGDPNAIKNVVVDVSNDLIKQPLTFIGAIGFLVYLAFRDQGVMIALVGALSIPICVFPIRKIGKYVANKAKQMTSLGAELNSDTIESIQSPMEIRAYNLQDRQTSKFATQLNQLFKLGMKQSRITLLLSPIIEFVTTLGLAFSLYLGVKAGMSMGAFMGLAIALYMAYEPLKKMGSINNKLRSAEASLERIQGVLDVKNTVPECDTPVTLKETVLGNLTFKNVNFHYENTEIPALKNINIEISQGEVIALVGHSGAGKTSFANLIPRFYDVSSGEVLLDGINLKNLKKSALRDQVAIVPQNPLLFNASIIENIRMGKLSASDDEVIKAAKQAYAHDFIIEQDKGYQTIVGERGNSLSGGQRQRIALARAFLNDAPILIMDEATSALDNDSEHKIQLALDKLTKNRTVFMIAHRFSSLRSATRTFYFNAGELTATGTHKELMASQPGYKELYEKSIT